MPVSASRTVRSATSAVMSAEPTPVGSTSTTSIPTRWRRSPIARTAESRSPEVIPPGSGVPVPGAGADVRLGNRVVAAEHDGYGAGLDDLAHDALDAGMRPLGIGRDHGSVAVVDDAELRQRVHLRLEVRTGG